MLKFKCPQCDTRVTINNEMFICGAHNVPLALEEMDEDLEMITSTVPAFDVCGVSTPEGSKFLCLACGAESDVLTGLVHKGNCVCMKSSQDS